jgi:hypothetical protein
MNLELPLKIKSIHLHVKFDTLMGEGATDLLIDDHDDDGDPNYRLKWVGPGVIPDSGPDGLQGEIPLVGLVGPVVKIIMQAAKGVASGPVSWLLDLLRISDDD